MFLKSESSLAEQLNETGSAILVLALAGLFKVTLPFTGTHQEAGLRMGPIL